jgi:diguanylate cyclase (GGDEF)-like protein
LSTLILTTATATAIAAGLLGYLIHLPRIRKLRGALAEATWQAEHDPLTEMANRTVATRHLHDLVAANRPATITLLDLDGLKHVNDTHGHHAGDQLLTITASRLATLAVRHGGTAYRLAGDEFLLLIPHAGGDPAEPVASLLTQLAAPARIHPLDGTAVPITPKASAGIAHFDGYNATGVELLHHADIALYHAKHDHQPWVIHHHGMQPPTGLTSQRGVRLRDHHPPRIGSQPTPDTHRARDTQEHP